MRGSFCKCLGEVCRNHTQRSTKSPTRKECLTCACRSIVASYEHCHLERTCEMDGKRFLPAIKAQRTHFAPVRRAENRSAPVPTARPTAPTAERSDAKCTGPGSDRPRTQSSDCRAGRAQCGTAHFARKYRWGGGPRTLTGTAHTNERTLMPRNSPANYPRIGEARKDCRGIRQRR